MPPRVQCCATIMWNEVRMRSTKICCKTCEAYEIEFDQEAKAHKRPDRAKKIRDREQHERQEQSC